MDRKIYCNKLELRNVRQFKTATFQFNPGFNLLIGQNGTGKTTVLNAITAAAGLRKFCPLSNLGFITDDIRFGSNQLNVHAKFRGDKLKARLLTYSRNTRGKYRRTGNKSGITLLFYRSNESIAANLKQIKGRKAGSADQASSSGLEEFLYQTTQQENIYLQGSQEFGRSQEIRKFVIKALSKLSTKFIDFGWRFEALDCVIRPPQKEKNISTAENKARQLLANLLLRSLKENPDAFSGIDQRKIYLNFNGELIDSGSPALKVTKSFGELLKIAGDNELLSRRHLISSDVAEVRLAPRIVIRAVDGIYPLNQLSDGEKRLFSLFVDIARILSLISHEDVSQTSAIVLIDEIDVHLHPKWQRSIGPALEDLFPSCQFIATTHSPFVIQSVDRQLVQELTKRGSKPVDQIDSNALEDIVEEIQDIEMPQRGKRAEELHKAAKIYFSLLQEKEPDENQLQKAEQTYRIASEPFSSNPAINALLQAEKPRVRRT